ncbi:M20/M25/M40 family metallo-hydrolase [Exiguobacterium acetylicum]|uniref:M20/M25/M40 family metallo-hydrolase n=1 Tax=Exiguobacterium acetylicum TaxID=41170 RepID=UPI0039772D1E
MMSTARLIQEFKELVRIDSVSFAEGPFQKELIQRFQALGLTIEEDASKEKTGLGANNFIARLEGDTSIKPLFFSSHMDTVSPGQGIQPRERDGRIESDQTTILGADDKAGIAIMIEMIQRLKEQQIPHGPIEFILTAGEEVGLLGAKAVDMEMLRATYGYVLDNGGPVGGIITTSPSMYRLDVKVTGRAAHAGLEPEKGISAIEVAAHAISRMKLGRIDHETTANIGLVQGGTAMNVVMEQLEFVGEVRSFDHHKCLEQVNMMETLLNEAVSTYGAKLEFHATPLITGYHFEETHPLLVHAKTCLETIGRRVRFERSGGGTDANVFNEQGKVVVNLSIGYDEIHTVNEYIPVDEFEQAVILTLELVRQMPSFPA